MAEQIARTTSKYIELGMRVAVATRTLRDNEGYAEVIPWAQLWATGLLALGQSEDAGLEPRQRLWSLQIDSPTSDPQVLHAFDAARAADVREQFQELALLALSQPLYDAIARCWFRRVGVVPKRDKWWRQFMTYIDANGPPELRDSARVVDVTLRIGRDRLVAHPVSGHLSGRMRGRDGRLKHASRIDLYGAGPREDGEAIIRSLNAILPTAIRSAEDNIWELARDLQKRAHGLGAEARESLAVAARLLGFEVDVGFGAAAMADLLEILPRVRWGGAAAARVHSDTARRS